MYQLDANNLALFDFMDNFVPTYKNKDGD